jgi:hypothetical protein
MRWNLIHTEQLWKKLSIIWIQISWNILWSKIEIRCQRIFIFYHFLNVVVVNGMRERSVSGLSGVWIRNEFPCYDCLLFPLQINEKRMWSGVRRSLVISRVTVSVAASIVGCVVSGSHICRVLFSCMYAVDSNVWR